MDQEIIRSGESGHGGHYITAITGSGNSEYLIRWTDTTARRFNATWTALHVKNPNGKADSGNVERNLALARALGAETITLLDTDIASCIIRYARIKNATAIVIGKAGDGSIPFLGRRSLMEEILSESGDIDVIILRGKTPVPAAAHKLRSGGRKEIVRGIPAAVLSLAAVTGLGLVGQPLLGYRSISILYLLVIIVLPFAASRIVVFASAACSALLWNFLFIPPRLTFSIGSLEDILMFLAFFCTAFVGGYLTTRLKEKESAISLRERRMVLLYGFTRAISRVQGTEEIVRLSADYLMEHLRLRSAVFLRNAGGLGTLPSRGSSTDAESMRGFDPEKGRRCFATSECVEDGAERLYIPLVSQGGVLGVLYVQRMENGTIRGESRELLATLAGNMALALEREALSAENERNKMAGETARLSKILLHNVSHELRTPLTTIKGSVSGLLEGNTAEDPQLREALLSETMIAANKLNVIVEDLLAMSRLEAGRLLPRPETVFVGELLGAAQTTAGIDLGKRSISPSESARDAEIEADPVLMVQVFRNILRNFAAYTPPGSTMRVDVDTSAEAGTGAGTEGYRSIIRFEDDGPGVPGEELPRIFDVFFRGSTGSARQGCGLGLSICRGIVETHGGTMEAGKGDQGGLLLTIRLPGRNQS